MSLDRINEGRTSYLPVSFFDEGGAPATPTTLTSRIDDEESRTSLRAVGEILNPTQTMLLTIDEDENVIVNPKREYEIHVLTLEWDYTGPSGPAHGTDQKRFKVMNLLGVA